MTTVGDVRKVITTEVDVTGATYGIYDVVQVVHERTVQHDRDDVLLVELLDDQFEPVAAWGDHDDADLGSGPMPSWVRAVLRSARCKIPGAD